MEKKNNTYNIYEKIKFVGHDYKDVAVFHTARRDNILITSDFKPVCINWNVTEISSTVGISNDFLIPIMSAHNRHITSLHHDLVQLQ